MIKIINIYGSLINELKNGYNIFEFEQKGRPRYLVGEISDNIPRTRRKKQKKQKQKMRNIWPTRVLEFLILKRPNPEISEEF